MRILIRDQRTSVPATATGIAVVAARAGSSNAAHL